MTDAQALYLLSEARINIKESAVLLRKIARHDPGVARVAVPKLRKLAQKQERLEQKARMARPLQGPNELGWIMPVIYGGMALLGIGGYVFKHHEETSLERYKLESIDKCIEENINAGMQREEASRICRELFTGRDLSDTLSQLSKTITIASLAIMGVYVVLRLKK